jgi:hypothetical protein
MRIKKLMSGNQNFDQSFYAALTRIALVCPREMLLLSSDSNGHLLWMSVVSSNTGPLTSL